MIIDATNSKGTTIDVLICEKKFVAEMYDMFRWSIGVHGARLRSGYWRHVTTNDVIRLATPEEIDRVEAFRVMSKVAEELQ